MKQFIQSKLVLLAFAFLLGQANAASISLTGSNYWRISSKTCTFTVGTITNKSTGGNSGSLRMALWMTAGKFPSAGYRVSTSNYFAGLKGGYKYGPFQVSAAASLPVVTGYYNFTITVEEYTNSGWVTATYLSVSDNKYISKGAFATAPPAANWTPPAGAVAAPLVALPAGKRLYFTLQGGRVASGAAVLIPVGSQLTMNMPIQTSGSSTVYGGSRGSSPCTYTYKRSTGTYAGKTSATGYVAITYNGSGGQSGNNMTLFFQSSNSGFYSSADRDLGGVSGTTYGVFSIR